MAYNLAYTAPLTTLLKDGSHPKSIEVVDVPEQSFSSYLANFTQEVSLPASSILLSSVDSDKIIQKLSLEKIQDIYILEEIQRDDELVSKNNSNFSVIA